MFVRCAVRRWVYLSVPLSDRPTVHPSVALSVRPSSVGPSVRGSVRGCVRISLSTLCRTLPLVSKSRRSVNRYSLGTHHRQAHSYQISPTLFNSDGHPLGDPAASASSTSLGKEGNSIPPARGRNDDDDDDADDSEDADEDDDDDGDDDDET